MGVEIPPSLKAELSKDRFTLFLGAGASREASFPSSFELTEFLLDEAGKPYTELLKGQSLDRVCEYLYYEDGYGKQWIRRRIIGFFQEKHKTAPRPPSKAHEIMTRIKWRTIFTTNYDRLIEVSYDSSPDCVQNILPIYTPDSQIFRHEADVVRVIKLNGSYDEAARNSNHELVLTFRDQQHARSVNQDFYNLLREEAINGPIIFCGFSFTHPGATDKGTSPEFQLLQELLKDMGPSARWHYYVAPFDDSDLNAQLNVKRLTLNQIQVINATFGEFIESFYEEKTQPGIPLLKKPPITIPIGNDKITIEPDEYSKDRHHFEIIGSHLLDSLPPSVSESLNGREIWPSFFNRHFIERSCKSDFLSLIETSVTNPPEIIVLTASPGWGKTVFLKDLSIDLYNDRRPVFWLNPYSTIEFTSEDGDSIIIGTWDRRRIDRIISQINAKSKELSLADGAGVPVIISDNCPERIDEVLSLFRYLNNNNREFILIIAIRTHEFRVACQDHSILERSEIFTPEKGYDVRREIRILIDHCEAHKVAVFTDEGQKEIVTQGIIDSEADEAIILSLQIIFDREHRPFAEVIKSLWEGVENKYSKELLLHVASLHRFGSSFYPRLYSVLRAFPPDKHFELIDAYNYCLDNNILFEEMHDEEPCVRTLHSLVAEQFTKSSNKTNVEIDKILLKLINNITNKNSRDLQMIRYLLKQINDYNITLSSEDIINELFKTSTVSTVEDYIVCQQFSKYLLKRDEIERAFIWAEKALEKNPSSSSCRHHKGNVLRRWGIKYKLEGNSKEAKLKFDEARKYFTLSRVGPFSDEYGYVTHLDMLLYLLKDEHKDENEAINLLAEGAQIYKQGLRVVPESKFNMLLDERFKKFDIAGTAITYLSKRIENALKDGETSVYAAIFLANYEYNNKNYLKALDILDKQKRITPEGILTWVKEAELHALEGDYNNAVKSIHSAKLREKEAESAEAIWKLLYLDLVISFILENYTEAQKAAIRLINSRYYSRRRFPRGYIWNESSRKIDPKKSLRDHAKIYSGRIQDTRATGQYGAISITNSAGENFYIRYVPRYFSRRDLRRGDIVRFAVTLLPNGLRAEDLDSPPFLNTIDEFYVKDEFTKLDEIIQKTKLKIETGEKIDFNELKLLFQDDEDENPQQ